MSNESNDLNKEKLNNKFIQMIQGKEFILYAGLLELAHKKGLNKLEIKLIQAPSEENNHLATMPSVSPGPFRKMEKPSPMWETPVQTMLCRR